MEWGKGVKQNGLFCCLSHTAWNEGRGLVTWNGGKGAIKWNRISNTE